MSRNKQSMHAELETVLSELHLSMERREAILAAAGRMTERETAAVRCAPALWRRLSAPLWP